MSCNRLAYLQFSLDFGEVHRLLDDVIIVGDINGTDWLQEPDWGIRFMLVFQPSEAGNLQQQTGNEREETCQTIYVTDKE